MKLTKPSYQISHETLAKVFEVLSKYHFNGDSNNEDVFEAEDALQKEITAQGP